jgi:anti-sigma factor RsiW
MTWDFDKERERREWDVQERALHAERTGARPNDDADVAEYRLVARALRNPPLSPIPSDFAARVAASVERSSRGASESVEVWLERGLVALLLLAGATAVVVYNGDWLRELSFSVPERAAVGIETIVSWSLAIAACVGLSSALTLGRKS